MSIDEEGLRVEASADGRLFRRLRPGRYVKNAEYVTSKGPEISSSAAAEHFDLATAALGTVLLLSNLIGEIDEQ